MQTWEPQQRRGEASTVSLECEREVGETQRVPGPAPAQEGVGAPGKLQSRARAAGLGNEGRWVGVSWERDPPDPCPPPQGTRSHGDTDDWLRKRLDNMLL